MTTHRSKFTGTFICPVCDGGKTKTRTIDSHYSRRGQYRRRRRECALGHRFSTLEYTEERVVADREMLLALIRRTVTEGFEKVERLVKARGGRR